jgi:polysaccharide export outer membrane protein
MMRYFFFLSFSLLVFSSCKIFRSNLMLRTPKDFVYDKLVDSLSMTDYKIAANDALQYRVFANNGFNLVNLSGSSNGVAVGGTSSSFVDVIVESDGAAKMPVIGRIALEGLTLKEAENALEKKYSEIYNDPFVVLRVTNRRVIVFPGNGGAARVLPLANNNTTVMEAIALASGIQEDGKAYKVKLIRNNEEPGKKAYVYLMDLSKIEGLASARSKVQAGDIIYVEPRYKPIATSIKEISPVLTLVTTLLILLQFYTLANP